MAELLFVGTIHEGITPAAELVEVVGSLKPDMVLVEVVQEDIDSSETKNYPPEMQAVHAWAVNNELPVYGFDSSINIMRSEVDEEQMEADLETVKQYFRKLGWKQANRNQRPPVDFFARYCDLSLFAKRQEEMARNIQRVAHGRAVVVTGAAHLGFFAEVFPSAHFPLREEL